MFRLCDAALLTAVINTRVLILGILSSRLIPLLFSRERRIDEEPALPGTRSADTRTVVQVENRSSAYLPSERPTIATAAIVATCGEKSAYLASGPI